MQSALIHSEPVTEYLQTEVEAGRVEGPFQEWQAADIQVEQVWSHPKETSARKVAAHPGLVTPSRKECERWHSQVLILAPLCLGRWHSSDPDTDGPRNKVSKDRHSPCQLQCCSAPGRQVLTWNEVGGKNLCRHGPIFWATLSAQHPKSTYLAILDTLEWILFDLGISSCLHYLDDFLTMGPADTEECEQNLALMLRLCAHQ